MVAGACMKIVKYLMFFFNLLFLLAGLAMLIIGIVVQVVTRNFERINGVAVFIIVIGVIIFLVAFLGCCGAIKENRGLLIAFGICMIIILVLSVAAIISAFVYIKNAKVWVKDQLMVQLKSYSKEHDIINRKFWDETQENAHCCGIETVNDWKLNEELNVTQSVPDSCCNSTQQAAKCGFGYFSHPNSTVYNKGCLEGVSDGAAYRMLIVAGVAICVAILQILGIILAFSLAHAIHKGYNVV